MTETTQKHGIKIQIPASWEDWSVLKYVVPRADTKAAAGPRLTANMIVTRHPPEEGVTLKTVFEVANQSEKARDASFAVVGSGPCAYLGQPAAFQDSRRRHPDTGVIVHQRHLAIQGASEGLVLVTLTGSGPDVAQMSNAIGLAIHPGAEKTP